MRTTDDMCAAVVAHVEAASLTPEELQRAARLRTDVVDDLFAGRRLPCMAARRAIGLLVGRTPAELLEAPEDDAC